MRRIPLALFAGLLLLLIGTALLQMDWRPVAPPVKPTTDAPAIEPLVAVSPCEPMADTPSLTPILAAPLIKPITVEGPGEPLPPGAVARLGTTRLRHTSIVRGLAFSPDGKYVASGSFDKTILLSQPSTGKVLRRWRLQGEVNALALSPNGKILAAAGRDMGIVLLDPLSGREIDRFGPQRHGDWRISLSFSPDSKMLAVSWAYSAETWDVTTGTLHRRLNGLQGEIYSVAYSPTGKSVALAGNSGVVLCDPTTGKVVRTLTKSSSHCVVFSPNGSELASTGSGEGFSSDGFRLWSAKTGKEIRSFPVEQQSLLSLAFSADGKYVASGGFFRNSVHLTDVRTGKQRTLRGLSHQGQTCALAFSQDSKTLAAGGFDSRICLWNVESGKELVTDGNRPETPDVLLSSDGKVAATMGADDSIRLWEIPSGRLIRSVGDGACHSRFAFSADGTMLVSRDRFGRIGLYETRTGRLLQYCGKRNFSPYDWFAFSRDQKLLAFGGQRNDAVVWDIAGKKQLHRFTGHDKNIYTGAFSSSGNFLVTAGGDGSVRVWSVDTGKETKKLVPHDGQGLWRVAFSADGKLLATTGLSGEVTLYDTATWSVRQRFDRQKSHRPFVALSPNGKTLAADSGEKTFSLWDVGTGKVTGPFTGHMGTVSSGAFTADGKHLVTGSEDGTALVWRVAELRPEAPVTAPVLIQKEHADFLGDPLPKDAAARLGSSRFRFDQLQTAALSPDGKTLAVAIGGKKGKVLLLDAVTGKEIRPITDFSGEVEHVAFSPNGKILAVVGGNDVYVWSLPEGKKLNKFKGHEYSVSSLVFSPDSKILAASGPRGVVHEGTIVLWDVAASRVLRILAGHKTGTNSLAFSHDGKTLASSGDWVLVRFWDVVTGKLTREHKLGQSVQFTPGLKTLAYSNENKAVYLWDVKQEKVIGRLSGRIEKWLLSPDGKTLITPGDWNRGERDVSILWDLSTGKELRRIAHHPEIGNNPIAFSPDGKRILYRGGQWNPDNSLHLWDLSTNKELRQGAEHRKSVTALVFTKDGRTLFSGSADRSVIEWDVKTGKNRIFGTEHANPISSLILSAHGKTIASGDSHGTVYFHDRTTGKRLFAFPTNSSGAYSWNGIESLVFTPDGKRVIAGDHGERNRIWDVVSGKELRNLWNDDGMGGDIVLSPDGFTLAVVGTGGRQISFKDLRTDEAIGTIKGRDDDFFNWSVFSPDGRILAVSRIKLRPPKGSYRGPDGFQLVLFEVATRQEVLRFGTPAMITAIIFNPDSRTLITGAAGKWTASGDTSVRIWDVSIGKEIAHRDGHTGWIESLALSPDGKTLASGSADGTILLWKKTWPAQWQPSEPFRLSREEQQAAWTDLASPDARRAYRAAGLLLRDPSQAALLMRERLRPAAPPVDSRLISRLIADLDSDDFAVREKARLGLEKEGDRVEFALRQALENRLSLEVTRRIERLLSRLESAKTSPERLQMSRAIGVLERIGTPEARRLLRWLGRAAPEAVQTREAKEAVRRLEKVDR